MAFLDLKPFGSDFSEPAISPWRSKLSKLCIRQVMGNDVAIFLVEFITVPQLGTSTFFLLMIMALIDVIAGFTVTVSTAHRGINISQY